MVYDRLVHRSLPVGAVGTLSLGWWGGLTAVATEGALLVYLLFSYFYVTVQTFGNMTPPGRPPLQYALPMTGVLILNIGAMWWASHSTRRNETTLLTAATGIALLLGVAFIPLEFATGSARATRPAPTLTPPLFSS
jgi:heme/copper-type cytochrome/quinol oxidase subunit 3